MLDPKPSDLTMVRRNKMYYIIYNELRGRLKAKALPRPLLLAITAFSVNRIIIYNL